MAETELNVDSLISRLLEGITIVVAKNTVLSTINSSRLSHKLLFQPLPTIIIVCVEVLSDLLWFRFRKDQR